eukprot:scaffold241362_cov19-Prasinocladus_malaysianus.AAC.1
MIGNVQDAHCPAIIKCTDMCRTPIRTVAITKCRPTCSAACKLTPCKAPTTSRQARVRRICIACRPLVLYAYRACVIYTDDGCPSSMIRYEYYSY